MMASGVAPLKRRGMTSGCVSRRRSVDWFSIELISYSAGASRHHDFGTGYLRTKAGGERWKGITKSAHEPFSGGDFYT
jgi:hypothetical protein